jgi:hypothetical protein
MGRGEIEGKEGEVDGVLFFGLFGEVDLVAVSF